MTTLHSLAADRTTTGADALVTFEFGGGAVQGRPKSTGVLQVDIVGTSFTGALQGRFSSAFAWVELKAYTANEIDEVVLCPEMRFNVSAITAATINVSIIP